MRFSVCELDRNKSAIPTLSPAVCLPRSLTLPIWLAASFPFFASLLIYFLYPLCFFFFYIYHLFLWIPLPGSPWEVSSSSTPTSSCARVSVSEPGTHRNAAGGQRGSIATTLPLPSPLCTPPPSPHRDPCCLDRCEWRSSGGWLRAKHIAGLPQQFKHWSAALFSLLKLCVQLCRQTPLTGTAVNRYDTRIHL